MSPPNDAIEEVLEWAGVKEDVERWAQSVIDNLRAYGFVIKFETK